MCHVRMNELAWLYTYTPVCTTCAHVRVHAHGHMISSTLFS